MSGTPYAPHDPGPYAVAERDLSARDGARGRTFALTLWLPEATGDAALPLIAYSHRSGGNRRSATFLARHLASHGYVVAALDHSETFVPELARRDGEDADARAARIDAVMAARVPDLRFLLDTALARAPDAGPHVDAARIGLAGHSFGGWTALATLDVDDRARSIVVHAPAGGRPTPPGTIPGVVEYRWSHPIPSLFIVAEGDTSLPIATMHELFARAPEPKRMVVLPDTDHLHFGDDVATHHDALRAMFTEGPLAHLGTSMRPSAELMPGEEALRTVRGLTLAHFDATLRDG